MLLTILGPVTLGLNVYDPGFKIVIHFAPPTCIPV